MKYILYLLFFAEISSAQSLPALIPYRKVDKWGYADSAGKIIVEPVYESADTMHLGVVLASANRRTYLINSKGEILFQREHVGMTYYHNNPAYDSLLFLEEAGKDINGSEASEDLQGFMNIKGEIVIPLKYHHARPFHDGMAAIEENDKWGFVDKMGKVVVRPKYRIVRDFHDGFAHVIKKYNGCNEGLVNKKGEEVIPCNNESVSDFSKGYVVYTDCHNVTRRLDGNMNEVPLCPQIPGVNAPCWIPGIYRYRPEQHKEGFTDEKGNIVIPAIYSQVSDFKNGYAYVNKDDEKGVGRKGVIDTKGNIVIPIIYISISEIVNGYAEVWRDVQTRGVIDTNGKYLLPLGQHLSTDFGIVRENMLMVTKPNKKCGYINTKGDTVIPFIYDGGSNVENGVIRYTLDKKMGIMDKKGKRITPPLYEKINEFHKGIAKVEDNGKTFYIDKYGRVYYEP